MNIRSGQGRFGGKAKYQLGQWWNINTGAWQQCNSEKYTSTGIPGSLAKGSNPIAIASRRNSVFEGMLIQCRQELMSIKT